MSMNGSLKFEDAAGIVIAFAKGVQHSLVAGSVVVPK